MDQPLSDPPERPGSGFSLLRPAVPPRSQDAASAPRRADGALGPFSARRRPERATSEAAAPEPATPAAATPEAAASGPSPVEELPWAVLDAPLWDEPASEPENAGPPGLQEPASEMELSSAVYEAEELDTSDEAEWLELEAAGEGPIAEDALEPLADAAEPGQEPLLGEELLAPPEWEFGYEGAANTELPSLEMSAAAPADAPPAPAAPAPPEAPGTASPALEDVASRLEQIARSLRGRTPADLLSGTNDPLQVLIAGYALGLEAARASREPPRDEG